MSNVTHLGTNNTMTLTTNASSASAAMTVAAGTNVVGFADIAWDGSAGLSVSTITQNGATMAAVGAKSTNTNNNAYSQAWWVAAPATGTLAATMSATCVDIYLNLSVYQTADQTTQPRAGTYQALSNPQTDASGNLSITVSSNVSDLTHTVLNGGAGAFTSSNQTSDGTNFGGTFSAASDHATTPAGSVTHTWAGGGATSDKALIGFSIQVVGGAAAAARRAAITQIRNPDAVPFDGGMQLRRRAIPSNPPIVPQGTHVYFFKNVDGDPFGGHILLSRPIVVSTVVSAIRQRRTLHQFGTHVGGRTVRGDS